MKILIESKKPRALLNGNTPKQLPALVVELPVLDYKTILVPIDFSDSSAKALNYAIALALSFGSQIRLLHVLESPAVLERDNPAFASGQGQAIETAETRLNALAQEKIDELIPVNSGVQFGRAYQVICETAQRQKCDLIVVGTQGFTGLKHVFLGSTAERVIRHAPCSVLAIRGQTARNENSVSNPKSILVPMDFSKPSEHALTRAIALAKRYEAKLHLLYVLPANFATGDFIFMNNALLGADQREVAQSRLAILGKRLLAEGIAVTSGLRRGTPSIEINEAAGEIEADLIVISTHGHTGWEHALLGSTTEEVIRHADCPVFIVRNSQAHASK
jgi:nucleotide-binding universal stress UspA family protein